MKNKNWKTVYIRVGTNKYDHKGRLKYKWVAIGRLYGYGTVEEKWNLILYKDGQ